MGFRQEIYWLLSVAATAVILHLVPYDAERVSLFRLEEQLRQDPGLSETLASQCAMLDAIEPGADERFFLRRFRLNNPNPGGGNRCLVTLESARSQRFFVRNYWHYAVHLQTPDGTAVFRRDYAVSFPRPLVLLPLAVFILSLFFGFRPWGLAWTLGTYILLLGGGNLIRSLETGVKSSITTLSGNQPLLGMFLILFWIALYRSRGERRLAKVYSPRVEGTVNRALSALVGLWNPAVFTAGAKLLLPFRGALNRVAHFLDAQFFIICGSLYLLAVDLENPRALVTESLLLPRYFSFAAVLFLSLTYWGNGAPKRKPVAWHQVRFWRGLVFVALGELLSLRFAPVRDLSTVTRMGIALCLSELVWPVKIHWMAALRSFLPWAGMLCVATFITLFGVQAGISHLILVIWEPTAHPTAVALFTFLSGVCLGFLTGNFATTFFTLYSVLIQSFDLPLVKAALIDGILAGSLLSPFSLFNLFPASQFGLNLQELIRFRFTQLAVPLGIALVIYAVCAINSVAILQPVTFVFLCLVALTLRLKKSAWQWRNRTA